MLNDKDIEALAEKQDCKDQLKTSEGDKGE